MPTYTARTTTDKLPRQVDDVESVGHRVVHYQWVGGRDWLLVCQDHPRPAPSVELAKPSRQFVEQWQREMKRAARIDRAVERGAHPGSELGGAA